MTDYEFPQAPQIEVAYRAAYRALESLAPAEHGIHIADEDLSVSELISQFRRTLDAAEHAVAATLGPLITWRGPHVEGSWDLTVTCVDLDEAARDFGDAELDESAFQGSDSTWRGSPLQRAAYAYKREARWDFTPDEAGVWMLMLAPVSASGGDDEPWFYTGHLVGFVILHDRDKDGEYESVAHIWTASAWRRRGVARRLLAVARERFAFTGVEAPYTEDGDALLRAVGEITDDE